MIDHRLPGQRRYGPAHRAQRPGGIRGRGPRPGLSANGYPTTSGHAQVKRSAAGAFFGQAKQKLAASYSGGEAALWWKND